MTYGEERARREARMAEMIAATGYERGDSRAPIFGEQIMGIWASETNPQRIGLYVETIHRTGRLNPGVWYRLTDGRGRFWNYEASQTLFVPAQPTPETRPAPEVIEEPCGWCKGVGQIGIPGARCNFCGGEGVRRRDATPNR